MPGGTLDSRELSRQLSILTLGVRQAVPVFHPGLSGQPRLAIGRDVALGFGASRSALGWMVEDIPSSRRHADQWHPPHVKLSCTLVVHQVIDFVRLAHGRKAVVESEFTEIGMPNDTDARAICFKGDSRAS